MRIGRTESAPPDQELSYRIIAREVPTTTTSANALRVVLRISLPLFAPPTTDAALPRLEWSWERDAQGRAVLAVRNTGTAHARVTGFRLQSSDVPARQLRYPEAFYVLPGSTRSWQFDDFATPARAQVAALLEDGREVSFNVANAP